MTTVGGRGGDETAAPRSRVHPEREAAGPQLVALLGIAAAVAVGTSAWFVAHRGALAPTAGLALGGAVGFLLVVGLPSLSLRTAARFAALLAAVLTLRLGVAPDAPVAQAAGSLVWMAAVVTLVVGAAHVPRAASGDGQDAAGRPSVRGLALRVAAIVSLLAILLVALAPAITSLQSGGSSSGADPTRPDGDGARVLASPEQLDMTTRPRLSDRLLLTVTTDRATFWRTDTFEEWDGRTWTRAEPTVEEVVDGQVDGLPSDLARDGADRITQRFRVETSAAISLPSAPSPVRAEVSGPMFQRDDGTLLGGPLGQGAEYTVESHRIAFDESALRAADGPIPPEVRDRWGGPLPASDPVVAAARQVTQGIDGTYEKVRALEAWMGGRTGYSLEAPLAPEGVDVVDHFLFESRLGWCEQIASSLVVLARAVGIPARLVTGFVPGERNALRGAFRVRERDAHAWAEIWFPDVGWVGFDPTAEVPFAGQDEVDDWTGGPRRVLMVVVAVLAVAGIVLLVHRLVRRVWRRWRAGHPSEPHAGLEVALERLGSDAGRPRAPSESASAYATALAEHLGSPELVAVGTYVDGTLYAPDPPGPASRAAADAALAGAAAGHRGRPDPP